MNVAIRELQPEDRPAIEAINQSLESISKVQPQWLTGTEVDRFFADENAVRLVVTQGDQVVAFAFAIVDPAVIRELLVDSFGAEQTLYWVRIAVAPDWRGRGVGGLLWDEMVRIARERGKSQIVLSVNDHSDAHRWCLWLGCHTLESQVWMIKQLD